MKPTATAGPDMAKVRAAVKLYGPKPPPKEPPVHPVPPAQDTAIRKPLTSHGTPCKGWGCHHFLHDT